VGVDTRTLIRTMSVQNPLWGAPRIHGELLKLGIEISQATVAKYMARPRRPPSQTWRTFLTNHVQQMVAAGFFVVPTAAGRVVVVLVSLALAVGAGGVLVRLVHSRPGRRRVVHAAVAAHPTSAWTAQQFRDAFPWDEAPRYLLHDRDLAFQAATPTTKAMGIREVVTAPRSPWQNAHVERFIGSVRRECLDHVIVLNAAGLQHLLKCYVEYYEGARRHLALEKDAPVSRAVAPPTAGSIIAVPQVGGLHNRYARAVASPYFS